MLHTLFYSERYSEPYKVAVAAWAVLLGIFSVAVALYLSVHAYIGVPFDDQWAVLEQLASNHGTYSLPLLWAQHNEHRVPLTKLLSTADLYWFRGRNLSFLVGIYIVQLVELFAIWWMLIRTAKWPSWMIAVGSGSTAFALFWPSQYESFLNPSAANVVCAFSFATVAIVAFSYFSENTQRRRKWFAASLTAALLSELNLANGILVWPLLLVMSFRFRLAWQFTLVLALAAGLSVSVFFFGFRPHSGHANPLSSFTHPQRILEYLTIYFGCAWATLNVTVSRAFASVGIVAALASFIAELVRSKVDRVAFALISLNMFLFGTGCLTALGRINFPVLQALSSRYHTAALLFWLSLALYLLERAHRRSMPLAVATSVAILLASTALVPTLPEAFKGGQMLLGRVAYGSLPLVSDVEDDWEIWNNLHVPGAIAFDNRDFLRSLNAGFYADPRFQMLGQPLKAHFQTEAPSRCSGAILNSRFVPSASFPGWELSGWASDEKNHHPVESTVSVRENQSIAGWGFAGLDQNQADLLAQEVSYPRLGWRAYVQGAAAPSKVTIFGLLDGGKSVCRIAEMP